MTKIVNYPQNFMYQVLSRTENNLAKRKKRFMFGGFIKKV